jgi:lipopolysaccharide export LptBFGC system permease protein LptF
MISPILIPILGICCGLVAIIGGVFIRPWMQLQQRKLEIEAQQVAEKAAQYAAHSDRLEQRVAVLERILTDRSTQLGDEIERLRDKPVN